MFNKLIAVSVCILWLHCSLGPLCAAQVRQEKPKRAANAKQASYLERAAALAFATGEEAAKLPTRPERIDMRLKAARLLVATRPEDAARLLNAALDETKECDTADHSAAAQIQTRKVITLRGEVLALYAQLDPRQADKLASIPAPCVQADDKQDVRVESGARRVGDREYADSLVKIGRARLRANPAEGCGSRFPASPVPASCRKD